MIVPDGEAMANHDAASVDAREQLPGSVLRLLAPRRRRAVMRTLMEEPNATHAVEDVVDALEDVYGQTDDAGSPEFLRSSLHHTHLPKLDDADVLEYDPQDGTVQYEGDETLEQWVEQIDRIDEC